jgi:hypothetical protein
MEMGIDIESRINEAEVCRSMGLFVDSLNIYEKVLSKVSPQDADTVEKIKKRIIVLNLPRNWKFLLVWNHGLPYWVIYSVEEYPPRMTDYWQHAWELPAPSWFMKNNLVLWLLHEATVINRYP